MRTPTVTKRLSEEFTGRIRSGQWSRGESIPTEMQLMREHRASRNSIRTALKHLEERGWLKATQGRGRQVIHEPKTQGALIGMFARGGEFGLGQGGQYLAAIDAAIAELQHTLILFAINRQERNLVAEGAWSGMEISQLHGAIVFARQYQVEDIERLATRIPVVAITHDATAVGVPSFYVDYAAHAAMAVRALASRGHREVALVLPEENFKAKLTSEIRRGFDLGRHFCALDLSPAAVMPFSIRRRGLGRIAPLLRDRLPRATAVISYMHDVLVDLQDNPAGQDFSDMISLADLSNVPDRPAHAGYFACPLEQLGRDAVHCLHAMLQGQVQLTTDIYHPYYGELTGLPPQPAPVIARSQP